MSQPWKHYSIDWDFDHDHMLVYEGHTDIVARLPYKYLTPEQKLYWNNKVTPLLCYTLLGGGHSLNDNQATHDLIAELQESFPYVN